MFTQSLHFSIELKDNQHFRTLSQTLDQLSDETYGSVGHHMKTEFEDRLKSQSNDRKLRQRYETQEVNQSIDDNSDGVNEDMFDNKYSLNSMTDEMQTLINSTSKPSTSQSSQEMANKDMNRKSSKCRKSCKSYPTDAYFVQHLMRTHRLKQYFCTHEGCGQAFKIKRNLTTHELIHNTVKPFRCPQNGCQYKCISDDYLRAHLKRRHNIDKKRTPMDRTDRVAIESEPLIKDTKFFTLNTSERNRCFDPKAKTWKCPAIECQKAYKTRKQLNQHLNTVHREPRFKCHYDGCEKIFSTRPGLDIHILIHKNIRRFKCDYKDCVFRGVTSGALTTHMVTHVTDKQVFQCPADGCGKWFKTRAVLAVHSRTHLSEPSFRCGADGCDAIFFNKNQRIKHQVCVHNRKYKSPKPHRKQRCDWPGCEYSGIGIISHKRKHTGERPHVCVWPDCGKRYGNKLRLRDHMNMHNNVRPYVCQWPGCEYTTTGASYLFNHKKFVHKM
ncbi:unnamed protein product [Medioppia subpectinata]|uniref:C2H2-type domain-containing protein n=1 Tax=Medioppia subpectinata TaxID=1979941 RepID=A0A7R9KZ40_9ACAR|nr:unnamed protein product [Medioppia subpectinata]CAG2111345.1 unnamed protein product [Medioppia subpectinata]